MTMNELSQEEGGRKGKRREGKAEVQELCRGAEGSGEVQEETGQISMSC